MLLQIVVASNQAAAAKTRVTTTTTTKSTTTSDRDVLSPEFVAAVEDGIASPRDDGNMTSHQSGSSLVLFYHIFLADRDDTNNSLSIVAEQLHQIGQSTALQKSRDTNNAPIQVYYNTVGNRTLDPVFMEHHCTTNRLQCHHLHHFREGFEFLTLQDLRRHCRQQTNNIHIHNNNNQHATVMYMHNKGSFHAHKTGAAFLRRSMTLAISSHECHEALTNHNDTCNVCGLAFSPWKSGPFFPGNFWMAQCRYVRQLLDPHQFRDMTLETQQAARHMHRRGKLTLDLFPRLPSVWGTGRYAAEYWVGSHPTIRPCDVTSIRSLRTFERRNLTQHDMHLQMSPREPYTHEDLVIRLPTTVEGRIREYFLMAGYIMRWRRYYHAVADDTSWVWNYFPEGNLWKRAVHDHGMREAVFQMLNNNTYLQSLLLILPNNATTIAMSS